MRSRARAWAAGSAAAVLLLAAGTATAFWFHLRSSVQPLSGEAEVAGLRDSVVVRSDSFGVPHVLAGSEPDLFFAQGYLHARHRLWQMELFRRIAQGRLSEIFGARALEADRLLRTLDLWEAAGRGVRALPASDRRALEAYAAGVNQALEGWDGAWPPEFVVLGIRPEPWSPQASAAVGKVMALDLSSWRRELSRYHAVRTLPPEKYRLLEPDYPAWGPTILPSADVPDSLLRGLSGDRAGTGGQPGAPARRRARAVSPPGDAARGSRRAPAGGWEALEVLAAVGLRTSNGWAVGPSRTRSGAPLVANDMHLGLRTPALWYLAKLQARGGRLHAAGLTLPGVPGVVVGFNRGVAWSLTNGMVDDMDFAVETVAADGSAYRAAAGWRDFAVRPETIRVRGREENVIHRVRETVRGPVISDALPDVDATLSALWLGRRPSAEAEGLLAMNRADDAASFDAAVRDFSSPHQNVIYAAADGTLGYRLSGTVPLRRRPGALPIPARAVGEGWPGTWPADAHPAARYPPGTAPGGFLAGANNLQAPGLFGALGVDYPVPFRARRIADLLSSRDAWTLEEMAALQQDTRSLLADRLLERAVAAARRAGLQEAGDVLASWDRRVRVDAPGAALFYAWIYRLRSLLAADEYADAGEWSYFPMDAVLRLLEQAPDSPWVDDVSTDTTETLAGLEERAARDALEVTGLRPWGELHRELHAHPLGRLGWLDRLLGLQVGPHPAPGGPRTVRSDDFEQWLALDSASWRPPWISRYGPSEWLVVSVEPEGASGRVLLPTGQGGNPLAPHYRDMAGRWRDGGPLLPLTLDPPADGRRLILRPGGR